jgi:cholesterol transport system auxiliary component
MTANFAKSSLYVNLILSSIILVGCDHSSSYYILDVTRRAKLLQTHSETILDVQRFTTDSAFASKALVYRKGDFEYESDFYNRFLVSPTAMLTEKTRNWLAQSDLFSSVLGPGSYIKPTHTLQANITALYADLRDKSSPAAVMQMSISLIDEQAEDKPVILAKIYRASFDLDSESPHALLRALDRCLEKILTDLEEDLHEKLLVSSQDS